MLVLMKAVSVAQTIPLSSGAQKPGVRSPRTPRKSGLAASAGGVTAASFRMASQRCPTVAKPTRTVHCPAKQAGGKVANLLARLRADRAGELI